MVLAFSKNQQEQSGIDFAALGRNCILLELELIIFPSKLFKLSFRIAELANLLRIFLCFYPCFLNLGIRSNGISQVLTVNQKVIFGKCSEQMQPLSFYFSYLQLVFSLVFSCCVFVLLGSLQYLILLPVSVFVQELLQHNEEEQSHFNVIFKKNIKFEK